MATYAELYNLALENAALKQKVVVACQDDAATIFGESAPSAPRKQWANDVLADPQKGVFILWSVLIANKAATVAVITSATDAAILTAVSAQVNKQYGAT